MKERSQLDEMRAAVRGDLERFRARQRANGVEGSRLERIVVPEPERTVDPPPEPERLPEPPAEPVADAAAEPVADAAAEPVGDAPAEPVARVVTAEPEPEEPVELETPDEPRRGLLSRLLGRR
jgi:hypothetical protein